jgi:hypothetical protein
MKRLIQYPFAFANSRKQDAQAKNFTRDYIKLAFFNKKANLLSENMPKKNA